MIKIIKKILLRNSPCRSLQKIESEKFMLNGNCLEIGNTDYNKKSFFNDFKLHKNHNLFFADILKIKKKNYFRLNLEKKNILRKKFDTIIIFNVLEHLPEYKIAFSEIYRILKKKGSFIGSVPFIYQIHAAPNDYFRFSKQFFELNLKKYRFKQIKYLPFFSQLCLLLAYILDSVIQIFVKTDLKEIFPLGYFFIAKK